MLYFMFILRIYLVCSRRCIIISIDGTSYKVEEVEVFSQRIIKCFELKCRLNAWTR